MALLTLSASKLMSFAALLAILLLLMSSELSSAAQPNFKHGMLLFNFTVASENHIYIQ